MTWIITLMEFEVTTAQTADINNHLNDKIYDRNIQPRKIAI